MLNAFCKSVKLIPVKQHFKNLVLILSARCRRCQMLDVCGVIFSKTRLKPVDSFFFIENFCVWS